MHEIVESIGLQKYSLYVMDYRAPLDYRVALMHPERVQALVVQNGSAYEQGLREFWDPIKRNSADSTRENPAKLENFVEAKSTRWQNENGVPDTSLPDLTAWIVDQLGLNQRGKSDYIFPPEGVALYAGDLRDIEEHLLATGQFAFETHVDEIADRIQDFLLKRVG